MLYKMKSYLLGILGSCLTVFLVYQILNLSTKETYIRYLDSTEMSNYTLLESLFLSEHSYLENPHANQSKTTINYNLEELKLLASSTTISSQQLSSNNNNNSGSSRHRHLSILVVLHYSSEIFFINQLDSVLRQTIQPTTISIVCSKQDKDKVDALIAERESLFNLHHVIQSAILPSKKKRYWFSDVAPDAAIDTIFILDDGASVEPGVKYFDFMLRLLQTAPFEHALIGTEKNKVNCDEEEERKARYVREIDTIWVLRREWFLALSLLPNNVMQEKSLSLDLYQTLHIPSVLIPSSKEQNSLRGNTLRDSTHCDHHEIEIALSSILFYMDKQSSASFSKLICQFSTKYEVIHVATPNEDTMKLPICTEQPNSFILHHKVDGIQNDLFELIHHISASVVIYEEEERAKIDLKKEFLLSPLSQTMVRHPTFISLPFIDKRMLSTILWMADLPIKALEQWHSPSVKLLITTSGKKRISQVKRIFNSIKHANYLRDKEIDLMIFMDEKSDRLTRELVDNLQWKIGEKRIHHRISQVHSMQQFTEAWYPSNNDEYAVMLDDRLELSPSYYIWIKQTILKYRYSTTTSKQIFGISLYSPRIIDTDPNGRSLLLLNRSGTANDVHFPYLMQVPSSSGALYFPEYWREFHDYITARLTDQAIVKRGTGQRHLFKDTLLKTSKSNRWINSWRKYFDEMIYMRGYVMLYPSTETSYSTLHIMDSFLDDKRKKKMKERFLTAEKLLNVPLSTKVSQKLPDIDVLPIFDLHGKLVEQSSTLVERGHQLQHKFSACEPKIDNHHDPSDMLCPFSHLIQIPIEASSTEVSIKSVNIYAG
ncbi:uncharacterized protein BX663DRAFT_560706 [Cokeromyces recurvatus]|uniref:uncharacterized protein n=1 Tax=Cokeromyces recurvatus TaxID=90255 RepID=UPI00221E403B|nr:uncharacterized protein BX663DRAFT_560706 [Cokeromyces recurvatus]KAI7903149.1 hypothetical protein BX663DRAFT_560706 [Cokeromyces recurvatus]